jgi:hypothetical protein
MDDPKITPRSKPARRQSKAGVRPVGRPPTHGANVLVRVLRTVPIERVDHRSQAGVFLRRVRDDLEEQLGSDVTPAQRLLIAEIARSALILQALGEWLVTQGDLVVDGEVIPAVLQRDAMLSNLTRQLRCLGLKRIRKAETLQGYLATKS